MTVTLHVVLLARDLLMPMAADLISVRIPISFYNRSSSSRLEPFFLTYDDGPDSEERLLWWKEVRLSGRQHELPQGRVGTRFVHMLAEEIEQSTVGQSEFLFAALILQRDKRV